jgi:hypothetical protein
MKNPRLFCFSKEQSNAFNPLYIKYLPYHPELPALPMDNDGAPAGAGLQKFFLIPLFKHILNNFRFKIAETFSDDYIEEVYSWPEP